MRLICPNCDAQYEVPDDVMPEAGRDVQCSNCGQTWFQHHPDHTPAEDEVQNAPAPDEEVAPPPPPPAPPPERERKQLDPAVADILRQEAEAEQEARRSAQQGGIESQPDLGLDLEERAPEEDGQRRAREARERMARMRGEKVNAPAAEPQDGSTHAVANAAALNSRRDLLPDIEEINSTLRASSGGSGAAADYEAEIEAPTHQRKKRGFRTGFMTVLLIVAILVVFYIAAPRIAAQVPALEGPMQSYINLIDQMRLWLDTQVKTILQSLDSAARDSNG